MLDRAQPDFPPPRGLPARQSSDFYVQRDPFIVRALLGTAIGIYLLCMGVWAWHAGNQIRDDAWSTTRTIRFEGDIGNAISRWGTMVVQTSQDWANFNANKHRAPGEQQVRFVVRANPKNPDERELGFWDLVHGVDQVYQNMVNSEPPEGDYGLDYPPLRLLTMTLWTRHVMYNIPGFQGWPRSWHLAYSATGDPAVLATEDIAYPVLMLNTLSIGCAALGSFFLVWIWVNRGGRPTAAQPRTGWTTWFAPRKKLVPWKLTALSRTNGLVLFVISATAFFYAMVIAENPVPAGPPTVQFSGRPILNHAAGRNLAIVTAAISGQGIDAQWHVDWGTTPRYDHQTSNEGVGADEVSATINNLPANTTIHYRITASSERGITRTDDATFNTADVLPPLPPSRNYGAVWLSLGQWFGIALLFVAMSAGLWMLPPEHKGWACGMVAGLLMWFNAAQIVDSHVWGQWDSWVLPPFVICALLCTIDWWFFAGVVLGVGMMFKGQTMISGAILIMWPLMAGRFGALTRMLIGFILAAGLVLSPWLVLNNQIPDWTVGPLRWICGVMAAAVISGAISLYRKPLWRRAVDVWQELNGELPPNPATPRPPYVPNLPWTASFDATTFWGSFLIGLLLCGVAVYYFWAPPFRRPNLAIDISVLLIVAVQWRFPGIASGFGLGCALPLAILVGAMFGRWAGIVFGVLDVFLTYWRYYSHLKRTVQNQVSVQAGADPLPVSDTIPISSSPRPQTSFFDLGLFCVSLLAGIVMITVLVLKRWPLDQNVPASWPIGFLILLGVLLPPWFLPRRAIGVWLAAILASTIWLSAWLYHGDWAWKTVGFEYGTRKFTRMALGIGSNGNLPQILETRWGWDVHDPVATFHLPDIAHGLGFVKAGAAIPDWLHNNGLDGSPLTPDIRQFLMWVFFSLVATGAVGLAIQSRRNHPRALAAFACVWILMSNVLCQMAGSYQMWGAAMTALLIGISPGLTILHFIVTALAAGIIGAQLLGSDPSRSPMIHELMTRFGPDDGWILLTIGIVILYVAIAPGRRPPKEELAL